MIPILYGSNETSFTSNGLGRMSDCTSCIVTEERNGIYECEFVIPVESDIFSKINEGCIVGCIHDDTKTIQPFEIYKRSEPINGLVTFYAHHISYKLMNVILRPYTASTVTEALASIPQKSLNTNPFSFWTDKTTVGSFEVKNPISVKSILGGVKGSILDIYGTGEYEWDKWTVKFHANRGSNTGIQIRYGKNLTEYKREYAVDETYNAVVPYYLDVDGNVLTLPEWFVYADGVSSSNAKPVPMDLSGKFDEMPTEAELRSQAQSTINNNAPWVPDENIKINFVELWQTEEYKDVALLERVKLCDTVDIYFPKYGITAHNKKVIKVVYNVLLERYDSMELGKPRTSFAESIMASTDELIKDIPTRSTLNAAIDNATELITGAKGGNVRAIYDSSGNWSEIVVMNTADILTATKVWRWNLGGFGYSNHGYNGPYGTAITMDGAIVADYITAGTLDAARIAANSISVSKLTGSIKNGNWKIDLDNGTFTIGTITATNIDATNLHVSAANVDGTLTANQISISSLNDLSGSMSGWTLNATQIRKTVSNQYDFALNAPASPGASDYVQYLRTYVNGSWQQQFYVTYDGRMFARNATITGAITATSGTIGGITLSNGMLIVDNDHLGDDAVENENIYPGAVTGGSSGSIATSTITTNNTSSGINTNLGYAAGYGGATVPQTSSYPAYFTAGQIRATGSIVADNGLTVTGSGGASFGTNVTILAGNNFSFGGYGVSWKAVRYVSDIIGGVPEYSTVYVLGR